MSETRNELAVGGLALALVIAGTIVSAVGETPSPTKLSIEGPRYNEKAAFCLTVPGDDESLAKGEATVTASGLDTEEATIGSEPATGQPEAMRGTVATRSISEPVPLHMVGYGTTVHASTGLAFTDPLGGLGAANCSREASSRWFFPYGSSEQGFNGWIVLYNPFRDEAVVSVDLLTSEGPRSKSQLSDVPVPSGGTQVLKINDYILQQRTLGIRVVAARGRVAAWRTTFAQPEGLSPGVGLTLGARQGAIDWFFPAGAIGGGSREVISVLNPSDDEAIVTVALTSAEGGVQPPADLVEFSLASDTTTDIDLRRALKNQDLGGVSVSVRSVNEVPIVVERAIWYSDESFKGFSTELGATRGATQWWVGPGGGSFDRDSLVLLNTTGEEATVQVTLMTPKGQPIEGGLLADVIVPAGGRARVDLDDLVDGASVALVSSDQAIVAERIAYSSRSEDVSTIMGIPLEQ